MRDTLSGTWQRTETGLVVSDSGPGKLALRPFPQGAYELEMKFVRSGGGMVGAALPVGMTVVVLKLGGWEGAASGLDTISGRPGNNNPSTVKPSGIVDGQPHTVVVRVQVVLEQATISATLDGKPYLKWTGPVKTLGSLEFASIKPQRLWLVTDRAQVTFTSVRLRVLNGPVTTLGSLAATTATGGN